MIILLQTAVSHYRQQFLDEIDRALNGRFLLVTGASYFTDTVRTQVQFEKMKSVKNIFLLNRRFLFQLGRALHKTLWAETLVLEANPRVLSTWVIIIVRRLSGLRTLAWGHVYSKAGRNSVTNRLRALMRSLCGEAIAYTSIEKKTLGIMQPSLRVHVVPNAISRKAPAPEGRKTGIIYCGRLASDKKVPLLISAFSKVRWRLPPDVVLHIVGDGPEEAALAAQVELLGMRALVKFHGPLSDELTLREVYGDCLISVSPGPVGLALTQSLGYGVPMVIAAGEAHGPEICLADSSNSYWHERGCEESLGEALVSCFDDAAAIRERTLEIGRRAQEQYSIEAMALAFLKAVSGGSAAGA